MIAVQCRCGHVVEVSENDAAVRQCCCGFLDHDECPVCQESSLVDTGVDLARPEGIPLPDLWDTIISKGEIY
jgi:hypothetical protein